MPNRAYISTLAIAFISILNAVLLCELAGGVNNVLSNEPIISGDFAFHQYYSYLGAYSLKEHLATWGYDSTFMGGAPFGPVFDPSNYLLEFIAFIFWGMSIFRLTKSFFVITLSIVPVLIFWSARNIGMNRLVSVVSALFSFFYLWLGLPKEVFPYGMFLYIWGAGIGIYFLSWWLRFYEDSSLFSFFMLAVSSILLVPSHIASPIGVLPIVVCSFVMNLRRLNKRLLIGTTISVLAAFFCALPWLGPYISFLGIKTSAAIDLQSLNIFHIFNLLIHKSAILELLLNFFAVVGFFSFREELPLRRWLPLAIGALFLIAFYFGGNMSARIAELEPRRFAVPLYFLLSIPAGRGFGAVLGRIVILNSVKTKSMAFALIGGIFIFLGILLNNSFPKVEKLKIGLTGTHRAFFDWINQSTNSSGRIMFEDSIHSDMFAPFGLPSGTSFIAIMPFYVRREFIGGPYPWTFIKHHYVDFCDGNLLGEPIGSYGDESMENILRTYNIKWVVSFSEQANRHFISSPTLFSPMGRLGVFFLWRVAINTGGFFLVGDGEINANTNELKIKSATYENNRVVLKYHWAPCLKVEPYGKIRKVEAIGGPVGFIEVSDAPPDFRIVPDYENAWLPFCRAR